jgi:hypothetical protein
MNLSLNQADRNIFVLKDYFNMLRPDFSDIQKNGYEIRQFRFMHSKNYIRSEKGVSTRDIIEDKESDDDLFEN